MGSTPRKRPAEDEEPPAAKRTRPGTPQPTPAPAAAAAVPTQPEQQLPAVSEGLSADPEDRWTGDQGNDDDVDIGEELDAAHEEVAAAQLGAEQQLEMLQASAALDTPSPAPEDLPHADVQSAATAAAELLDSVTTQPDTVQPGSTAYDSGAQPFLSQPLTQAASQPQLALTQPSMEQQQQYDLADDGGEELDGEGEQQEGEDEGDEPDQEQQEDPTRPEEGGSDEAAGKRKRRIDRIIFKPGPKPAAKPADVPATPPAPTGAAAGGRSGGRGRGEGRGGREAAPGRARGGRSGPGKRNP